MPAGVGPQHSELFFFFAILQGSPPPTPTRRIAPYTLPTRPANRLPGHPGLQTSLQLREVPPFRLAQLRTSPSRRICPSFLKTSHPPRSLTSPRPFFFRALQSRPQLPLCGFSRPLGPRVFLPPRPSYTTSTPITVAGSSSQEGAAHILPWNPSNPPSIYIRLSSPNRHHVELPRPREAPQPLNGADPRAPRARDRR